MTWYEIDTSGFYGRRQGAFSFKFRRPLDDEMTMLRLVIEPRRDILPGVTPFVSTDFRLVYVVVKLSNSN